MPDQSFADWWLLHKDELMQAENTGLREIAEAAWNDSKKHVDQQFSLFVDLAEQVRDAQITYFDNRTGSNLAASKKIERELDKAIANYRLGKPISGAHQLSLLKNGGGKPKLLTGHQLSFIEENNNGQSE